MCVMYAVQFGQLCCFLSSLFLLPSLAVLLGERVKRKKWRGSSSVSSSSSDL